MRFQLVTDLLYHWHRNLLKTGGGATRNIKANLYGENHNPMEYSENWRG